MGTKKARYSNEFKVEAVKLVTGQGYTQVEAAKRLGINAKNLNRWIKESVDSQQQTKRPSRMTADQEECQR